MMQPTSGSGRGERFDGHQEVSSDRGSPELPVRDEVVPGEWGTLGGKRARGSGREKVTGYRMPSAERLVRRRNEELAEAFGGDLGAFVPEASAGSFTPEVIWDGDDRIRVDTTQDAPFRWICALDVESQSGQRYVGTGWFIGERTLITAGHVVYLHQDGGWARRITVLPAATSSSTPFGQQASTSFRSVSAWVNHRHDEFDYGAILLPDATLGQRIGRFGYAALTDASILGATANLSGYPADKHPRRDQWFHARAVSDISPRKLYYTIDTFGGQSGSPVWQKVDGERIAVGVHTGATGRANTAIRINQAVKDNFDRWVRS